VKNRFRRMLSALGVGNVITDPDSQAWKPTKGQQLTQMFGASGTLNFQGWLTDLGEYNSDFKINTAAFQIYEQMRRGDSQVFALLCTLSLPILSARWDVAPPEAQATATEKEAADLVRENLFGGLEYVSPSGMCTSQSWTDVLRHALLMLPFGCSAMEEIWEVDGDTIRLARLAPRMPPTYYRYHVDTDGETLMVLEQHAYRGSDLEFWKIPADKLTLFNYQQEGAYFQGRSLLRAAYSPWFYKTVLEKIEAIAAEHNAMGVPTGVLAPDSSVEDRNLFQEMLQKFVVEEGASFVLPNGADFKLVGVGGRLFDCGAAIARKNQEITRVGLASFLDLGTTAGSSGSRALGTTLSDFFYLAEQGLANAIAWNVTTACVRRMVDFNYPAKFGRGKQRYPHLTVANVQSRNITAILEYLDKLAGAALITPDDGTEDHVREQLGFPKRDPLTARVDAQTKVTETIQAQATAAAPSAAPATTPGSGHEATTAAGKQPASPAPAPVEHSAVRTGHPMEAHVPRESIEAALDGGTAAVAGLLRQKKPELLRGIAAKVATAPARGVHKAALPPLDGDLSDAVQAKLADIYQAGRASIEQERASQRAAQPAKPAPVQLDATGRDALHLIADTTVGQVQNQLGARAKSAALAAQRGAQPAQAADIAQDVDGQSDAWVDRAAADAVHQAFSNGRQDGFAEHRDEIQYFIYSAMLDANTCDDCAEADGKEGQEGDIPDAPNPNCQGGGQCRCMWIAIFKPTGGAA